MRHEIVHNGYVVEKLAEKGAIFVDELSEVPDDRPVIFSAHGVPKSVPRAAERRNMIYVDATCPLVSKVHRDAERHFNKGYHIILIGHAGHPEIIGTLGQLPKGKITLVENLEDVAALPFGPQDLLAYATQTTLSVDETTSIIAALQAKFPLIKGPQKRDICYATTNRQQAVRLIAGRSDALMVIGASNSSNSQRLVDVARRAGCPDVRLVERAKQIDWSQLKNVSVMGVTAGASAPEILVEELISEARAHFNITVEEVVASRETVTFNLPASLRNTVKV